MKMKILRNLLGVCPIFIQGFIISVPTDYGKVNRIYQSNHSTCLWTSQNNILRLEFDKNYSHVRGRWNRGPESLDRCNGLFLDYPYFYGEREDEDKPNSFSITCVNMKSSHLQSTLPRTSSWQVLETLHGGILWLNDHILIRLRFSSLSMEDYQSNLCIRQTSLNLSETLAPWIALVRIDRETILIANLRGDILFIGMNRTAFTLEIVKLIKHIHSHSIHRLTVKQQKESGHVFVYMYPSSMNYGVEIMTFQKTQPFMWRILQRQMIQHPHFRYPMVDTIHDNYHYYLLEESGILYKIHCQSKEIQCLSWNQDRWINHIYPLESGYVLIVYCERKTRHMEQIQVIHL